MSKQTKITKSAQGQDCQVRIPGVCNHNPETTVLAHLNGGGMGMKAPDWQGAYCCSACHSWLDGGWTNDDCATRRIRDNAHYEAVFRTQALLIEQGLLEVK